MPLEDITMHVDALGKDLVAVDELVENIVRDCGGCAEVSVGMFRMGGRTEIDPTPDGSRTKILLGEEISSEYIIHIAGVPHALATRIRETLTGVFLVLDNDFTSDPEDPPDIDTDGDEEEDPFNNYYLGDPEAWKP